MGTCAALGKISSVSGMSTTSLKITATEKMKKVMGKHNKRNIWIVVKDMMDSR